MIQEIDKPIMELCELITRETDPIVFVDVVKELSQRLDERGKILSGKIRLVAKQSD